MNDIERPIPFGGTSQASQKVPFVPGPEEEFELCLKPRVLARATNELSATSGQAVPSAITKDATSKGEENRKAPPASVKATVPTTAKWSDYQSKAAPNPRSKGKKETADKKQAEKKKQSRSDGTNLDAFKRDLATDNDERRTGRKDQSEVRTLPESGDIRALEKELRKLRAQKKKNGTWKPKVAKSSDKDLGIALQDLVSREQGARDAARDAREELKEAKEDGRVSDNSEEGPDPQSEIDSAIAAELKRRELEKVNRIESETLKEKKDSLGQVADGEFFTFPNGEQLDGLRIICFAAFSLILLILGPLWLYFNFSFVFSFYFCYFVIHFILYPFVLYFIFKKKILYTEVCLRVQRVDSGNKHQINKSKQALFDQDLRPDLISHADIKHNHPIFTTYRVSWEERSPIRDFVMKALVVMPDSEYLGLGIWARPIFLNHYSSFYKQGSVTKSNIWNQTTDLVVSAEALSQFLISRTMNYSVDPQVFKDRVRQISSGLSKMNYDRYSELFQQNLLANTEFIAFTYFLSHKVRFSPLNRLISPTAGGLPDNLARKVSY